MPRWARRGAVPRRDGGRGPAREVAEQDRAQLRRREWLGDEVVAPGLDRASAVGGKRERGHGDDRDARRPGLGAKRAREAPAVHPRKEQVDEHRVGPFHPRELEAGHAVRRDQGLVARGADDPRGDVEVVRVVLDDQDAGHQRPVPLRMSIPVSLPARTRIGRVKWKTLPLPTSLSTQMRPPCSVTRRFEIASPRPVPP